MWNCTPAARNRCSQARSSGAAFMSFGNTRPDVPDKGLNTKAVRPIHHLPRPECLEHRLHLGLARTKTAREFFERLRMREVEPATSGQQELAADRSHCIVDMDLGSGGG